LDTEQRNDFARVNGTFDEARRRMRRRYGRIIAHQYDRKLGEDIARRYKLREISPEV
jgi:hypothetical protein